MTKARNRTVAEDGSGGSMANGASSADARERADAIDLALYLDMLLLARRTFDELELVSTHAE